MYAGAVYSTVTVPSTPVSTLVDSSVPYTVSSVIGAYGTAISKELSPKYDVNLPSVSL